MNNNPMDEHTFTREMQINKVTNAFPHVVILGAGASIASVLHNPEKHGKRLPAMENLIETLDLGSILGEDSKASANKNFEDVFSELYENNPDSPLINKIENKIYEYFSGLELPDTPTIYDYLIMSLRSKDLIATFNWDPFLCQAFQRCKSVTENLPRMVFLHGSVSLGICYTHGKFGYRSDLCPNCRHNFARCRLMYPVKMKNYDDDPFLSSQWKILEKYLEVPAIVTVFGYSAPATDTAAIQIMKKAYGPSHTKNLTELEFIDIKTEDQITETWRDFIHSHHFKVRSSYFDSFLAMTPRRTGEVYEEQFLNANFHENNPVRSDFTDFKSFSNWFSELLVAEGQS